MIAMYRAIGDTSAEGRPVVIERDSYDGCLAVARAETPEGEQLIHIRIAAD